MAVGAPAFASLGPSSAIIHDFSGWVGPLTIQGKNLPTRPVPFCCHKALVQLKTSGKRSRSIAPAPSPLSADYTRAQSVKGKIEFLPNASGFSHSWGSEAQKGLTPSKGASPDKAISASKPSEQEPLSTTEFLKGKIDYKVVDPSDRRFNGNFLGMALPSQRWELNQIKQMKLELGSSNDAVKLSILESEDVYQADPSFLLKAAGSNFGKLLLTNKLTGKSRFLAAQTPVSLSGSERVEFNIIRDPLVKFSVFGMHAKTGDLFQASPQVNIQQNDGVAANREMTGAGVRAAFGPISLMVKGKRTTAVVGANAPWQNSFEKSVSLDVADALTRLGAPYSLIEGNIILPSSIYAAVSDSAEVSPAIRSNALIAAPTTKSRSIGATWGGSNVSADISYYDYFLNSHLIGDANYDYGGKGISASMSTWTDRFTLTGNASFSENNNMSTSFRDSSRSISIYASSTIHLENSPDVFMEFTGFGSDYYAPSTEVKYRSSALSSAVGLDFSKFIPPLFRSDPSAVVPSTINFRSASLKTFYRYQDGFDFIAPGQLSKTGHFLGLSFRAALN